MPLAVTNLVERCGVFFCGSTPPNFHICEAEMHVTPLSPHTLFPTCVCQPTLYLLHSHPPQHHEADFRLYLHHHIPTE